MKKFTVSPSQRRESLDLPRSEFWAFFKGPDLQANPKLWQSYLKSRRHSHDDYALFLQDYCRRRDQARAQMGKLADVLPNAAKGKAYSASFTLPDCIAKFDIQGLDKAGLSYERAGDSCVISGKPMQADQYDFTIIWIFRGWMHGMPVQASKLRLLVNPDPADLWRNLPSDQTAEYARPDAAFAMMECDQARMWAASVRGRSHAHTGLPRDDAFCLACCEGWQILAVADGAGSAPFSRKGADIACQTAIEACQEKLRGNGDLARLFEDYQNNTGEWLKEARKQAYNILPHAALAANKAIRSESEARGRQAKEYATTLLLCASRRFARGWAVLSFQIGDGAMALLTPDAAQLLAIPDEGEYGGQTRFITMNELFEANELMNRLQVRMVSDLMGLMLMTDGVSDALLPSMQNLSNPQKWHELWVDLLPVCHAPDPEAGLLDWLNFWSRGNHDDRTIAVMASEN